MATKRSLHWRNLIGHYALAFGFSLISGIFLSLADRRINPVLTTVVFGTVFGSAFAFIDFSGIGSWKHRSFLLTSLIRTLSYGLAIVLSFYICISVVIFLTSKLSLFSPQLWLTSLGVVTRPFAIVSIFLALLLAFLISSILAISKKLGPGVMMRWLTGHYHTPRAEERVFMFLDIRDSTTLAERLGDLRFSALVRDFMADLSDPVMQTRAEVSHYIGDEAVLVWMPERAFKDDACVRFFTLLRDRIEARSPHYLGAYGLVPSFKAGVHQGTAIVTEVGEVKSEIVYHGDTLNTAARIQGLCNELGYDLLVSETVSERLSNRGEPLGQHSLKGRVAPVALWGFGSIKSVTHHVKELTNS